jgi:acetolactate synthase-1/2/3 large subunit
LIKVADQIAQTLVDDGIRHVFMLTGGAAMHLNDALGNHPALDYICCHHEQACAMAAESYFRVSGKLAVLNVTAGPGAINALNGVFGAYVDSMGMIVISGQAKRETMVRNYDIPLRQLGDQEVDIISMVHPITKYATVLHEPEMVRQVMEKAIFLATHGRPGPVWVDVPIDVQASLVDPEDLPAFEPEDIESILNDNNLAENTKGEFDIITSSELNSATGKILAKLNSAVRPVIFAGAGVRISGAYDLFLEVISKMGVPVVTGWNAHDLIPNDHPQYAGRPGTVGDRAGNFSVQNADFLLVLGSRLNIRQVSYNWKSFARHAWIAQVDIDPAELSKPTLIINLLIQADLKDFLNIINDKLKDYAIPEAQKIYLNWCLERVKRYPVVLPEYWESEKINPYCFMDRLFSFLEPDDIIVTGDGTACVTSFQAAILKKGQRLYTNSGCASMGYDLPGAIGASVASNKKRVVCIAGDGSIMLNLQELQTIIGYDLPVKIFVLNNSGYHSIRQTQNAYFPNDEEVGVGPDSGLSFPNFQRLAKGFGFKARFIGSITGMDDVIQETIETEGPQFCEVILDLEQQFSPKLSSRKLKDGTMVSSPLEDMAPFLDREELAHNLLYTLKEDKK